jgi:hypothetical protein
MKTLLKFSKRLKIAVVMALKARPSHPCPRATRNDAGTPVGAGMPARRNPYAVVNTKDVPCTQ